MFCPQCGSTQSEELKFCKVCGVNLAAVMQVVAARRTRGEIRLEQDLGCGNVPLAEEKKKRRKAEIATSARDYPGD